MNKEFRIHMIKAMEFLCRSVNDENNLDSWLMMGVSDGDIDFGDLDYNPEDEINLEYYLEDESFSELMSEFLFVMSKARKSGGLYCDDVVSK